MPPKTYLRMRYFVDVISHLTTANGSVLVKNFYKCCWAKPPAWLGVWAAGEGGR